MIRFHFQFPRSPDAAFGGWLFNLKCKFSCRIISNIANHLKYNYFWEGDDIDNVTLRLWKLSDFCSRHSVGVAGDDIMFHILIFDLRLNKKLSKQSWGWLRRHRAYYDVIVMDAQLSAPTSLVPVWYQQMVMYQSTQGQTVTRSNYDPQLEAGRWIIFTWRRPDKTRSYDVTGMRQLISPWKNWPPFWQRTISNAFSWMKMIEFRFKFHWNMCSQESN